MSPRPATTPPLGHFPQGYAYILTHPGTPCLFWEHLFDCGPELADEIAALVDARKAAGVHAESKMEILAADADMYVARVIGEKANLIVKLGPRYDMGSLYKKGWKKINAGHDYGVWREEKQGEAKAEVKEEEK